MAEENKTEETLSETNESSVEVTDKIEAQFDEFLSAVDADENEIGVAAEAVEQPEEAPTPEPAPTEDTSSDQEEAGEQPEATEDVPELEKALSALRRDGLPNGLIEKMSNDEILEYGEKRSKVQGDTDNAYRELSELKKAQEIAPENSEKSEVPAEPVDQPSPVNLQTAIQPFADIFGDDAAEALRQVTAAAVQPYQEQIAAQQNVLEGFLMREARSELEGSFPSLATDEGFASVEDRMRTLVKSGEYNDIKTLMSDASRLAFAGEGGPLSNEQETRLAGTKASGQPTVEGASVAHSGPPMTEDERDEAILSALEDGKSPADVKRLFY